MQNNSHTLWVIFGDSRVPWPGTRRALRLLRRRPCRMLRIFSPWLVGEWSHVAMGHNGVVVVPMLHGDTVGDLADYVVNSPGLLMACTLKPCFGGLPSLVPVRRSVWGSLLTWATRGRYRSTNCVQYAIFCLRRNGYAVPRHVTTPGKLHDWLREHTTGEWHELAAKTD